MQGLHRDLTQGWELAVAGAREVSASSRCPGLASLYHSRPCHLLKPSFNSFDNLQAAVMFAFTRGKRFIATIPCLFGSVSSTRLPRQSMSSTTCKAAEKETFKKAFEQRLEAYLEARKEYHRLYDQKHKKAILEEKKKRIDENPDLFRKRTKQYYQNHKEELCAYQKVRRETITETQQAAYLARREARREARTQELSGRLAMVFAKREARAKERARRQQTKKTQQARKDARTQERAKRLAEREARAKERAERRLAEKEARAERQLAEKEARAKERAERRQLSQEEINRRLIERREQARAYRTDPAFRRKESDRERARRKMDPVYARRIAMRDWVVRLCPDVSAFTWKTHFLIIYSERVTKTCSACGSTRLQGSKLCKFHSRRVTTEPGSYSTTISVFMPIKV